MNLFLTPNEIQEITNKVYKSAQVRALRAIGIEHRVRADGTPLVLRAHIENLLGKNVKTTESSTRHSQPNWEALQ